MSNKLDKRAGVKHIRFQFINTAYEARAMLNFLVNEILRHGEDIKQAKKDIAVLCKRFNLKPPKQKEVIWYETNRE